MATEIQVGFKRHPLAEDRTRCAVTLIKGLLQMPGLIPEHRREFLKIALWKVTEAEGSSKHKTQFQSLAARSAPRGTKLQHDHVFQRAMVDMLLEAAPDAIDAILKGTVGCTITRDEHTRLNEFKHLDGWDRYRAAGIVVIDMDTGKPSTFPDSELHKATE